MAIGLIDFTPPEYLLWCAMVIAWAWSFDPGTHVVLPQSGMILNLGSHSLSHVRKFPCAHFSLGWGGTLGDLGMDRGGHLRLLEDG